MKESLIKLPDELSICYEGRVMLPYLAQNVEYVIRLFNIYLNTTTKPNKVQRTLINQIEKVIKKLKNCKINVND